MQNDLIEISRRKCKAAGISVASNSALVLFKLTSGMMIGSVSLISEAIHSGIDLLASLIALFAVRTSSRPADEEHPFGHGKFENVSGTIEALLIFLAATWIIYEAVLKLINPKPLEDVGLGVAIMLISVVANTFVSNMLLKVGKETDSMALQADAWHLRTDIYTSMGVMSALTIIWLGGKFRPDLNLQWIDSAAAIAVALLILRAAYHLTIESARDLFDVSLPPNEEDGIQKHIRSFSPTIRGFHKFRTRKSGSNRFVEFHILVDPAMSIDESHRIADMITCSIKQHYPGTMVTIHIEPCHCELTDGSCGCILNDPEKKKMHENFTVQANGLRLE